jgi:hypothetical protein
MKPRSPFTLNGDFAAFQEEVLDYCFTVTERAGTDQRHRRLAFWGTLALMRCVGSSPAAAVSALSNRLSGMAEEDAIEPVVFDAEDGVLNESDIEPATAIEDNEETAALRALIERAQSLASRTAQDPKLKQLLAELRPLIKIGAKPVIFCRFIATAEALGKCCAQNSPRRPWLSSPAPSPPTSAAIGSKRSTFPTIASSSPPTACPRASTCKACSTR